MSLVKLKELRISRPFRLLSNRQLSTSRICAAKNVAPEKGKLSKDGSFPFMSKFQKNRFTTEEQFGLPQRWKHESTILILCYLIFVFYWGYFREGHHVDEMIESPPYLQEHGLRLAIARMKDEGKDTSSLEAQLENLLDKTSK